MADQPPVGQIISGPVGTAGLTMARRKRHREEDMEINLIPMIDIMLILLIFFMVATTIKTTERALPIVLPASSAAIHQQTRENLLVLGVDAAGVPYMDSKPTSTGALHSAIKAAAEKDPDQPVRIDGDRNAPYERIVEIIELCQFEGLRNISLHTRTRDEKLAPGK